MKLIIVSAIVCILLQVSTQIVEAFFFYPSHHHKKPPPYVPSPQAQNLSGGQEPGTQVVIANNTIIPVFQIGNRDNTSSLVDGGTNISNININLNISRGQTIPTLQLQNELELKIKILKANIQKSVVNGKLIIFTESALLNLTVKHTLNKISQTARDGLKRLNNIENQLNQNISNCYRDANLTFESINEAKDMARDCINNQMNNGSLTAIDAIQNLSTLGDKLYAERNDNCTFDNHPEPISEILEIACLNKAILIVDAINAGIPALIHHEYEKVRLNLSAIRADTFVCAIKVPQAISMESERAAEVIDECSQNIE